MIIIVNALKLDEGISHHLGGNYYHVENLSKALVEHTEHTFHFLADEYTYEPLRTIVGKQRLLYFPLRKLGVIAADQAVIRACRNIQPTVYHRPAGQLPFKKLSCKTVAGVADLNFKSLPMPLSKRIYKELSYRWTFRRADAISCVSQYTRNEILKYYDVPKDKLSVVLHGTNLLPGVDQVSDFSAEDPYWITLGHQAHKNVEACLRVMALYRREQADRLVIVGQCQHIDNVLRPLVTKLDLVDRVSFVGRVEGQTLRGLYEGAIGLLFMSYYEGFGLPVLEAMNCGCPVICSNVCSLPEIIGDAGISIMPDDLVGLSTAMQKISTDSDARASYIKRGYLQARQFTWEKAAAETIALYKRITAA